MITRTNKCPFKRSARERTARIAELNDALRASTLDVAVRFSRGELVISDGVYDRGLGFVKRAVKAVGAFKDFTAKNDPHGQHDLGWITVQGTELRWRITYFDRLWLRNSPDPADPTLSQRQLTISLESEH